MSAPTFVLEGARQGNLDSIQLIKMASKNPLVRFFAIPDEDHFSVLAPMNQYLASRIVGPWSKRPAELSEQDVAAAMK